MEVGAQSPNRLGFERTGTLPFMALELLREDGYNGLVPRRYAHELESFGWVLVWVSRRIMNGEELTQPFDNWLYDSNVQVHEHKAAFVGSRNPHDPRLPVVEICIEQLDGQLA